MSSLKKLVILLLALPCLFATKPYYGGEVTIRLNEPDDFTNNPSNYSNLVFYSFIYENFFYLTKNGEILTHIFQDYRYDKQTLTLNLHLKDGICFSNGKPVTAESIEGSLKLFMDMNLASGRKLRRAVKQIRALPQENRVLIELMHDDPTIVGTLASPELVLITGSGDVFSGLFYPVEWEKGKHIVLKANPFYPGGRCYLDSLKVVFYNYDYPDVFLGEPATVKEKFSAWDPGVYQNVYLAFPGGKEENFSMNVRVALYSLMKEFFKSQAKGQSVSEHADSYAGLVDLNTLTSNEESPVSMNIKTFPVAKVRSVLRHSKIKLYMVTSLKLKHMEESFTAFLKQEAIPIETVYVRDDQLLNVMTNTPVKYLIVGKIFNHQMPVEEKIKKILKELSFDKFDEEYLKLVNQLDELKNLKNDELTMNLVSTITSKLIQDGVIMPLYQKRYALLVKDHIKGIGMDYFGRPIVNQCRVK